MLHDVKPACRDDPLRLLRRPIGRGVPRDDRRRQQVGGVVVIHHFPGYDEATKEIVRKFAANGYNSICVNLYYSRVARGESRRRGGRRPRARRGAGRSTGRRRRSGRAVPARVGELEPEGRRHRLLLRGTPVRAGGLQPGPRGRRRLLRRLRRDGPTREHGHEGDVHRGVCCRISRVPCWASSGSTISIRRPNRPRRFARTPDRKRARSSPSTSTRAPDTPSSPSIARPIDPRWRPRRGARSGSSTASTSRARSRSSCAPTKLNESP